MEVDRLARQSKPANRGPKLVLLLILILLVVGAGLYYFYSYPHRQAVSVARTYISYEETGDYGAAWELLDARQKAQMDQATYISLRSQLFLQSLKAHAFDYKIDKVTHFNTWRPDRTAMVLKNVYQITIEQQFKSQFGEQTLISRLYLTKDPKAKNNWRILFDQS
jgi:uncharacterized protein HemX